MGEAYYYLRDAHGDTIGLAESTGSVIKDYKHDAFGNLTAEYGTGAETPFRYNGQYTDDETGLIYLRNRYYDPSIGRFTQEDTYWNVNNMIYGDKQYQEGETKIPDYSAIAQSSNLYIYCMSDPVNGVDPTGRNLITDVQRAYFMYGLTVGVTRAIWTLGADFYLDRYKGWYLTATLLKLSVNGENNQSFVANGGDYAAEAIRNNQGFNAQINNDIWNYASLGYTSVDFWGSYAFNLNGDLGAALHNTDYHVKGNKNSEGRWDVYVSVYDTFDFTEFIIPVGGEYTAQETFLWIVNDAAAVSQAVRIIKPVSVEINYKQTY